MVFSAAWLECRFGSFLHKSAVITYWLLSSLELSFRHVSFKPLWMLLTSGFLFPALSDELFGEFQADFLGLTLVN